MLTKSDFQKRSPLIQRVRDSIRLDHKSIRTEDCYIGWIVDFFFWTGLRKPELLGDAEVTAYLSHLATERNVAQSTQRQALNALVFLFNRVLNRPLGRLNIKYSSRPANVPDVLTKEEVSELFTHLNGDTLLLAQLAYGTGMRLMELLKLRLKDLDFGNGRIAVRDGKGEKDRVVPMPQTLKKVLKARVELTLKQHESDLHDGYGSVWLPDALVRKYPNASKEPGWQYLFPSKTLCKDPRSGIIRRHHIFPNTLQEAIKSAAKTMKIRKRCSPHAFRHAYASHLLESGTPITTVQKLLGHKDVSTTMIYTHCIDMGRTRSPVDML